MLSKSIEDPVLFSLENVPQKKLSSYLKKKNPWDPEMKDHSNQDKSEGKCQM